jgi:hypothetical protein
MNRIIIMLSAAGIACGALAQQPLLMSGSQELKLDFSEAQASIQKMSRKLKPMSEKLSAGSVEIQKALDAVKADPNALTKAKFEKALADHMRPVMKNMDTVLESELEMQCALEDVSVEVKRVALRIRQDMERNSREEKRIKDELKSQVKDLQRLAGQVSAEGTDADREKVRELRRLQQQVSLGEKRLKLQEQVVRQLKGATYSLAASSDNLTSAADNAQIWFENLASNRGAFRDLIRMRMDMANIASMGSAGAGKSLNEMLNALGSTMQQINGVGDLLAQMGGTMESMDLFAPSIEFDIDAIDGGVGVDPIQMAEDILNKDFSYLND